MSSTTRLLTVPCFAIACLCCLIPRPGAAQQPPIGDIPLPPSPIVVDLENATIRIVTVDSGEAALRWWRARAEEAGADQLAAMDDAGGVLIQRPAAEEGETLARLLVDIAIATEQQVAIRGSAVELIVERALPEEPETAETDTGGAVATAALLDVQLAGSSVNLAGHGDVTAVFDGCDVDLRQTSGQHQITVVDSSLRVIDHTGNINVTGEGADVLVEKARGQTAVRATGGSVDLRSTRGKFNLQASAAQLQLIDVGGSGSATLTDSNLDLRNSSLQSLQLKGQSSHATLASCNATTTVNFVGGSVTADDVVGDLTATARDGATVSVTGLRGKVKLDLQQDVFADLRDIHGEVTATARGADLTVGGAGGLAITANDSTATLYGISKLSTFNVSSSDVELDLAECRDRSPALSVGAESTVRVRLPTPCRVAVKGISSTLANQIDVTGCELRLGPGNRWATNRVRGMDGRPPITLTAQVSDSAELSVEGRP